jgi:hypothetical protein
MNEQEIQYFRALSTHRSHIADTLDDPAVRGFQYGVVEKYSDQAHFICELLQNADDAKATSARFNLFADRLIFGHNGTRHFSISDQKTEKADRINGKLGDINSITSIAHSNKNIKEATIGKFGLGFKSVFQYTASPRIYDPNVFFRIDRFIVPSLIKKDFNGRRDGETLFELPFDHAIRVQDEAYEHISEKLNSLGYPLLFLSNLKEIFINISNIDGVYEKKILQTHYFDDVLGESIMLSQHNGNETRHDNLWLFSRKTDDGHSYSVGFFIDDFGNLVPRKHKAFCYFPTKVVTELNFIVHAPFLLNDSREGIQAGVKHNIDMIDLLSKLAADSIVILRDIGLKTGTRLITDDIFDIIPYDKSVFTDLNDRETISFMPFYDVILKKFKNASLLPARDGYISKNDAYWAHIRQIAQLFSDDQLALLTGNKDAKWVFSSFGRYETVRKNSVLTAYIESITRSFIEEVDIINGWKKDHGPEKEVEGITASFIEAQPIDWLHKFYKWIAETKTKTEMIKSVPIFLNDQKNAVAAYDNNGNNILFLPPDDPSDSNVSDGFNDSKTYMTISRELLKNDDTLQFILSLKITKPSLRDEIYNKILPLYKTDDEINDIDHFKKFFAYYKDCPLKARAEYIKDIKNCPFLRCSRANSDRVYRSTALGAYFRTEELLAWFKPKPMTWFVRVNDYLTMVEAHDKTLLHSFLNEIGVHVRPRIIEIKLSADDANKIKMDWSKATSNQSWTECYIDGCSELIQAVIKSADRSLSVVLWNTLILIIRSYCGYENSLDTVVKGVYKYHFRKDRSEYFESAQTIDLRTRPWLLDSSGIFVSANKLSRKTLYTGYDVKNPETERLCNFLGILDQISADDLYEEPDDNSIIVFGESLGLSVPEQRQALTEYAWRKTSQLFEPDVNDETIDLDDKPEATEQLPEVNIKKGETDYGTAVEQTFKEISKRITSSTEKLLPFLDNSDDYLFLDEDYYSKPPVDIQQKAEKIMGQAENKIKESAWLDCLRKNALTSNKYSFSWFKNLLELESLNCIENKSFNNKIIISFSEVQLDVESSKTVILKHPDRYIPPTIENMVDIPLELHFGNQPVIQTFVEIATVQSSALRVKFKTGIQIKEIDLSLVTEARIETKNPSFLLDELHKAFVNLAYDNNYNDDFNMQTNICKNIDFVLGTPGTGKTKLLANEIIMSIMYETDIMNILVLTPTNKAADILVSQVMAEMGEDRSYLDWLVRFGTTNDIYIEQCGVFRDRTFDISTLKSNVTVTTIARFPFDYYQLNGQEHRHLSEIEWDYIIIDEASMIPLANIIYPLFKTKPKKFIIAGDPFQIEPVMSVDIWKSENIYTMIKLNSFSNPTTVPHEFNVKLLTTQYRSVPEIGELYSRLAYNDTIEHYRTSDSRRPLNLDEQLDVGPLNIIKFPVTRHESIFRPKRLLGKSNCHIYSALFTAEFVKYLSSIIQYTDIDDIVTLGVIAPYRAQSDLIDRLMASVTLPVNMSFRVGTVHDFQGDECDIVVALFNPPPKIIPPKSSGEMFLNKTNIINMSINRARDYLFIIMPDDDTENVNFLTLLKRIERICNEFPDCVQYHSSDLENLMFDSPTYIEDNTSYTDRQLINVYSSPGKKFDIRSDDNTIDIEVL